MIFNKKHLNMLNFASIKRDVFLFLKLFMNFIWSVTRIGLLVEAI